MATEQVFDTERLIQEVKERPCLWDLSSDDYANRIMKKQKWEEITMLFGGDGCTSAAEKNELCASIQKKWRHIKDAFNREKRRISATKSGSGATRKSQYIYYNMLSFLHNATPPTNTQQSLPDEYRDPDDDLQATEDIVDPTTPTQQVYHTTVLAKKRKAQDDIGKQLVNVLKESVDNKRQLEKETLNDQDRLFLMSLVDEFKSIPQHKKLSAKRQILLVIEQHQAGGSNNMGHFQQGSSQTHSFSGLQTQPMYSGYDQRIYQQGTSVAPPMNTGGYNYQQLRNTPTPNSMTGSSVHDDDQGIFQQGTSVAPPINTGGYNYQQLRNTPTPNSMTGSSVHDDDQGIFQQGTAVSHPMNTSDIP